MKTAQATIINKAGLHARASSKLVDLVSRFEADIKVGGDKMVNGRSILALMMLGATRGTELNIAADGPDEERAVAAIVALIGDRFGEDE